MTVAMLCCACLDGQLSGPTQLEGEEERLMVQAMLLNQDACRHPHRRQPRGEHEPGWAGQRTLSLPCSPPAAPASPAPPASPSEEHP